MNLLFTLVLALPVASEVPNRLVPAEADSSAPPSAAVPISTEKPAITAEALPPVVVERAADRPAWVAAPAQTLNGTHYIAVESDPFAEPGLCRDDLERRLVAAAGEYIDDQLGYNGAAQLLGYTSREVLQRELGALEHFEETPGFSFGQMHVWHARLAFAENFRQKLFREWHDLRAGVRLARFGLLAGLGFVGLATVFGCVRCDLRTRGQYTLGLRGAAAVTILTLGGAGYFLLMQVPSL